MVYLINVLYYDCTLISKDYLKIHKNITQISIMYKINSHEIKKMT